MRRRQKFPASTLLSSGIVLRKLHIAAKAPAAGCRILFFSDTHFRFEQIRNHGPDSPLTSWEGFDTIGEALLRSVNEIAPEILIFGGDLTSQTTLYPGAFELLKQMSAPLKLAIPGNWERKNQSWLPIEKIKQGFEQAGFHFLINESVTERGIQYSGVDDFRFGEPVIPAADPMAEFRILLTHNPDLIGKMSHGELKGYHLALCGHTHGGQIRIPFFGAVRTSSRYWKRFEWGICSTPGKPAAAVSAGIGATYILHRVLCPPEMLLVELKN